MFWLKLRDDCDLAYWAIADAQGRIPIEEHYPVMLIDGEDCYAIEYSQLHSRQKISLINLLIEKGLEPNEAKTQAVYGAALPASAGEGVEFNGRLYPIGEDFYAPESPSPFEGCDFEEVV